MLVLLGVLLLVSSEATGISSGSPPSSSMAYRRQQHDTGCIVRLFAFVQVFHRIHFLTVACMAPHFELVLTARGRLSRCGAVLHSIEPFSASHTARPGVHGNLEGTPAGQLPRPTQGTFQTKRSARKLVGVGLPSLGINQLRASHSSFTSHAFLGRFVFSFSSSLLAFFFAIHLKIYIY